ncbi:MAG TPA: hypothetical protein VKB52_03600 [Rhodanobacteraceae bacterium]|nr:hypothetical protein [Rhodanobacteraceae bacterium]
MKPTLLYRIAAVLLVLFAAGHTVGFLRMVPPTAEGVAVRDAMRNVHFAMHGGSYTYAGFYDGFGLSVSAYLVFTAFLAWHLGQLAARDPRAIGALGWVFCAMQVAQLVLGLVYFFAAPVAFSALIVLCLGIAAWRVGAQSPA